MEHTTDYKMYNQDKAIKIVDKLDIDMSGVQDPKDVQTDRCAIALLEHNAPQTLAFNDKVQGVCCIDSTSNKLECLTLLTRPVNYRLINKTVYASEGTGLLDTYKVQFQIQELEGRVVTPMPKGIADRFQIPYIEISDIGKWSKKEYETPKEFDKYYPSTENAEGAEEAEASGAGPWVAGLIPKILPILYGHRIVTGDTEVAEVLESVSQISMAADVWASCVKILKRNNWNSFVYPKKTKKGKQVAC